MSTKEKNERKVTWAKYQAKRRKKTSTDISEIDVYMDNPVDAAIIICGCRQDALSRTIWQNAIGKLSHACGERSKGIAAFRDCLNELRTYIQKETIFNRSSLLHVLVSRKCASIIRDGALQFKVSINNELGRTALIQEAGNRIKQAIGDPHASDHIPQPYTQLYRTIEFLIAAGFVTREKVNQAKEIARSFSS
jgi:hypothetical protein